MTQEAYNIENIVKIQLIYGRISSHYRFRKEFKILGITFREEGIYCSFTGVKIDKQKELDKLFLVDSVVYDKPRCVLYFSYKTTCSYYFETDALAQKFYDDISNDKTFIKNKQ